VEDGGGSRSPKRPRLADEPLEPKPFVHSRQGRAAAAAAAASGEPVEWAMPRGRSFWLDLPGVLVDGVIAYVGAADVASVVATNRAHRAASVAWARVYVVPVAEIRESIDRVGPPAT
jgi:hypothetical protein